MVDILKDWRMERNPKFRLETYNEDGNPLQIHLQTQ